MRKKLIIANWKAYLTSEKAVEEYFGIFAKGFPNAGAKRADVVICPPFPYLSSLRSRAKLGVQLGAQDVFWGTGGPYTGEITTAMLKDEGGTHVII